MKKLVITIIIMLIALTLCGCEDANHPNVIISPTMWRFDEIFIPVGDGYEYKPTNPYDIVETEEGIDVLVHFKEKVHERQ